MIRFDSQRITLADLDSPTQWFGVRVMASGHRAQWKGFLKFGGVSCGVAL